MRAAHGRAVRVIHDCLEATFQAAECPAAQPMMGLSVPLTTLPQVTHESLGRAQSAQRCRCEHGWNTTATCSLPHCRHVRRCSSTCTAFRNA